MDTHNLSFLRHGETSAVGGANILGIARSGGNTARNSRSQHEKFVDVVDYLQRLSPDDKVLLYYFTPNCDDYMLS